MAETRYYSYLHNSYQHIYGILTFKCELFFLDQDANWIAHEARAHFQHILRHRSRQQDYLQHTYNTVTKVEIMKRRSTYEPKLKISCFNF